MARRLPPLSALRAFEAVARLGSVTRAGEELGRTHSAVSRQLRALQEHAGLAFLDKAGTGLRLNAHGEALRQVVAGALETLEQGWARVLDEARGPSVHVACSATFAMRWLVPHLPGFYRRHPEMKVRLSMTTAQELRHQGADLVIAWDRRSYPARDRERAIRLAEVAFGPVCAPGYKASVKGKALRCTTRIAHEHTGESWNIWQAGSGLAVVHEAELRFPHTHLCLEAALSGLGVALVEQRIVRDDLAAGRLVAPCGFTPFADGLAAIPASEHAASPAARAFVAWIRGALAEDVSPAMTARQPRARASRARGG
ncbi:LysR substrate-binding domain-containing protein [Roseococcus pinisoli]|uniref:LysR family transcriptional regulator n=1 Tax=Roseococcus pinisoli TaxID=2835040 RepID=A0ABS5QHE9_9PROT|nr:LysR substrate-binding domain-containing protein [Roseococcus pinisoli]MBS7813119.1 LysR family transcriptional regulator [Roseococcus pinisoli]